MSGIKPIFIFCLPRSGSTLLQRVLMSHSKISSVAEPHLLLPLVYSLKNEGILAKYSHSNAYKAIEDLVNNLPNKVSDYYKYINQFILNIYTSLSDEKSIYFLDKTPNYFWIIPEIEKIFPNAKFIFLFRNPIQIYASMLTTFGGNSFDGGFTLSMGLLEDGFGLLSEGYQRIKDKSHVVNYEFFINNQDMVLQEVCHYLEIDIEERMQMDFKNQDVKGRISDPTGIHLYMKISDLPLEKWKSVFTTKYRKKIIKDFILRLDQESLEIQGYDKLQIINEINNIQTDGNYNFIRDFINFNRHKLLLKYNLNLWFGKNLQWVRNQYLS